MKNARTVSRTTRVKPALVMVSAVAVGAAMGTHFAAGNVPLRAAAACCQTSWDCGIGEYCDIDTTWTCQPEYYGRCVS